MWGHTRTLPPAPPGCSGWDFGGHRGGPCSGWVFGGHRGGPCSRWVFGGSPLRYRFSPTPEEAAPPLPHPHPRYFCSSFAFSAPAPSPRFCQGPIRRHRGVSGSGAAHQHQHRPPSQPRDPRLSPVTSRLSPFTPWFVPICPSSGHPQLPLKISAHPLWLSERAGAARDAKTSLDTQGGPQKCRGDPGSVWEGVG